MIQARNVYRKKILMRTNASKELSAVSTYRLTAQSMYEDARNII